MGAGFSKVRWRRGIGSFGRLKHLPSPGARVPTRMGSLRPRLHTHSASSSPADPVKPEDNAEGEAKSSSGKRPSEEKKKRKSKHA